MASLWYILTDEDKYLYHYTSAQTLLDHILPTRRLKFSEFKNVNDPREALDFHFGYAANTSHFPDDIENYGDQFSKYIKTMHKLACFVRDTPEATIRSDDPLSYLPERGYARSRMWSQYASQHTGVCLVFEKAKLKNSIEAQIKNIFSGPIEYGNDNKSLSFDNPFIIDFDKLQVLGNEHYFKEHLISHNKGLFFRKSGDWSQEREWRFILQESNEGDNFVDYGNSLEGIILGWKIAELTENKILSATSTLELQLAKLEWRNGFPQPIPLDFRLNNSKPRLLHLPPI